MMPRIHVVVAVAAATLVAVNYFVTPLPKEVLMVTFAVGAAAAGITVATLRKE